MPNYRHRRYAARTQPPRKLARKIQQLIDAAQAEWDDVMGEPDPTAYADVRILTGTQAKQMADSNAPVVITYDGAGYDMLSNQGEMEYMGGSQLRTDIRNAAAEMGYMTEDLASWAMGFYPDESAEVFNPPKREMPKWMQEDLEAEFGPFGGESKPAPQQPKAPTRPEEQRRILDEMRMSSVQRRRRRADDMSLPVQNYESRAKDIMFEMWDDTSAPWEQLSTVELAETASDALGFPEWTDDPNHPVWEWAYQVVDAYDEGEVDEDLMY
jgi:hypothetical protein